MNKEELINYNKRRLPTISSYQNYPESGMLKVPLRTTALYIRDGTISVNSGGKLFTSSRNINTGNSQAVDRLIPVSSDIQTNYGWNSCASDKRKSLNLDL